MAWLINPFTKSFEKIQYDQTKGRIEPIMIASAYTEAVDPREYKIVKDLLGADDMLHVAPYTIKKKSQYIYKIWVKDILEPDVPGAKFFKADAVFKDMMLLVKYKKVELPTLTSDELINKIIGYHNTQNMFYDAPEVVDCEDPREYIKWIKKNSDQASTSTSQSEIVASVETVPIQHGFMMEEGIFPRDFLYTCGHCRKACENRKCSLCKKVYYCDATCQKSHWKTHKKDCTGK